MSNPLAYLHDQLEEWKRDGVYQRLRILQSESAAESLFDGKEVINLASNNYLGLTTHPKLREAAIEAVETVRRGFWRGAYHFGNHGAAHGAGRAHRATSRMWKPAWCSNRDSPPMPVPFRRF